MRQFIGDIAGGGAFDDAFIAPQAAELAGGGRAFPDVSGIVGGNGTEGDSKLARKEAVNDMKKAHIMDAALRVLARNGFANVRLEDIAEEAGFSKAAIYHYFPDKEAVLMHIVIRKQRAMYEECEKVLRRELPFFETVKELVTQIYYGGTIECGGGSTEKMVSTASFVSNVFIAVGKNEELLNAAFRNKLATHRLVTQVIAKAREAGILNIPLSDDCVCLMIMSFTFSATMELYGNVFGKTGEDTAGGGFEKWDINWVINALTVFLEPWIKDNNPNRRWYDVQSR